jgi:hypothetical protein
MLKHLARYIDISKNLKTKNITLFQMQMLGIFHVLSILQLNLIFNEKIVQYSRTFALQVQTPWNQAHAPLLIEIFPKTPRTQSKTSRFGEFHN